MYQSFEVSSKYKNYILDNLYLIIGQSVNKGTYAFKGGYVLAKKIKGDLRRTSDLDMSILNEDTFDLVINPILGFLNNLKNQGIIWDYKISKPRIENGRNISGWLKLYVKESANSRARVLCGIDISIHPIDTGVELSFDGFPQYMNEYMLSDKIAALYSDETSIMRRIRDVLDIYLILCISDKSLSKELILYKLRERKINISEVSTFELLLNNNSSKIIQGLKELVDNSSRINSYEWNTKGISLQEVIERVKKLFFVLRR